MLPRFIEFGHALRKAGLPVAVSENIDALNALEHLPLSDRESLRSALAATMIKSQDHRPAFNVLFDLYFGSGAGPEALGLRDEDNPPQSVDELRDEVLEAVGGSGDGAAMRDLARRAVARLGRLEQSRGWYSYYEVARALDLGGLLRDAQGEIAGDGLEATIARDRLAARMEELRTAFLAETRRRVAEHRGAEAVAQYAVEPLPDQASLLGPGGDIDALRKAIRPLARKLASRVAMKRKRATRGGLDVRRTIRHSLSAGGVPIQPMFRRRPPHRPELFILCDVSSSVARFARFALMLTHALSAQFNKVRSFAFVDTIDEVTRFFEHEDFIAAVDNMNREAEVVSHDGHSDYGATFDRFLDDYGKDVGPKATLLILGDARNNYRPRGELSLKELCHRAKHSYWLNPEPKGDWDTGDSTASDYAPYVDAMVEVSNLKQLEDFIARRL
jgi:uncharacterized protein